MPELFNIVDFTMTQSLDMLLQMYGRLLRKSDMNPNKTKIYFKVATKNTSDYFVDLMTAMLCLTNMEWYSKYNGKNMGGIRIPKVLNGRRTNSNTSSEIGTSTSRRTKPYISIEELGIPLDLKFFKQDIFHSSNSLFDTVAWTTLDDVRKEFFGLKIDGDKDMYINLFRKEKITAAKEWEDLYKDLSQRDGVRYSSSPWSKFNQKVTDFFDECFGDRYFFDDKEHYITLIRDEKHTSNQMWIDNYKSLSERDGVRYHSLPWKLYGLTAREFFDLCYPNRILYNNKDGYYDLLRKEKIRTSHQWKQKFKELSERDGVRYSSIPWTLYSQTPSEFFDECFPNRNSELTKKDYFKLLKIENITSEKKWVTKRLLLKKRDKIDYRCHPWKLFNMGAIEFFDECFPNRLKRNYETNH
jgi:hypothetical protein